MTTKFRALSVHIETYKEVKKFKKDNKFKTMDEAIKTLLMGI